MDQRNLPGKVSKILYIGILVLGAPQAWAQNGTISLFAGTAVGLGASAAIPVTLSTPAPDSGITVTLTSSDPSKVTVTSTVFIPSGRTSPNTQPQVSGVNLGSAAITASATGFTATTQQVNVTAALSFPIATLSMFATATQNLALNLSGPAPAGGLTIALSSDSPAVATAPANVTFPAGANSVAVPLTAIAGGSTVIRAIAQPNLTGASVNVNVVSSGFINLPTSLTLGPGQSAPLPIALSAPAPASGLTITLTSNHSSLVAVAPLTILIPGGATAPTTQAQVTGVSLGSAIVVASAPGFASGSVLVNVIASPPAITSTVAPVPNAAGWNNANVTVTFTCAGGAGGIAFCSPPVTVSTETASQTITGIAKDASGNSASISLHVKLDKTPPLLTITSPASTIAGTVFDALSGIAGVTCNGTPAALTGSTFTCTPAAANSVVVAATDIAGNTASSSVTLPTGTAPTITFASPANLSYLNLSPTTVNGTVSDPAATVTINGIGAPLANGQFSVSVPLAEGPNILTATATSTSGATGTASITVTLDTTPPHVTITTPPDKFVTTDAVISVAGNVNDIVVGTVNDQQAQVTVNGLPAQVANRTFLAPTVPLTLGANVIDAVARDRAGNSTTTQITVTRQAPAASPQIHFISGNNQTGVISAALTAPLVVALTDASNNPVPNAPVIFKVTQNNGMISAGSAPAPTVVATTSAQGQAQAQWTLGARSGAGGNTVEAYSVGSDGTAIFTATGTQGPPGIIVIDSGNNQTGAINLALPKPLIAVVVDSGNNRLPGVPVTFTVKQGGGSFAGQLATTATTDSDGRAAATLTLGLQEGNSNNLVEVNFPSNQNFPASFTASGRAQGDPAQTTISGVVLDNSNVPIPGVTIRALLTNVLTSSVGSVPSAATAQTDAKGQFTIAPSPVGFVKLLVDGSTASLAGTYPTLDYDLVTVAGQSNTVGQPIFLLPIKTTNQLCVSDTTGGGTLTIPEAPGFSLTFGPNQVTFPGGSKTGCVSVTVVHPDKVPMTPGFGQQPRFIVTIQPAGALFNPPAPISLPNVDGLAPRAVTEMYSFDHDIGSFVAIGTGVVSDDGQVIRSSQGVGVLKAGWHCGGNPSTAGAAATCGPCATCVGQQCSSGYVAYQSVVSKPLLAGRHGKCSSQGYCTGIVMVGATCGAGGVCDKNGNCVFPSSGGGGGCPGTCNSGNPCIDDSCPSGQCVATPNQMCQQACKGLATGATCSVGSVSGTCDASGNCNLCQSLGAGASCTCGGGGSGTCNSSGQCSCPGSATISGIGSNQFPGAITNYLPFGGGSVPSRNYILVAAQADGLIHAIATLSNSSSTNPPCTPGSAYIAFAQNRIPTSQSTCSVQSSGIEVTMPSPFSISDYTLVVGIDTNNDGILDPSEVLDETTWTVRAIGQFSYTTALVTLRAGAGLGQCFPNLLMAVLWQPRS